MAYVQLDLSASLRPVPLPVPGLDPGARYRAGWAGPVPGSRPGPGAGPVDPAGPVGDATLTAAGLVTAGLPMPPLPPHSAALVEVTAV